MTSGFLVWSSLRDEKDAAKINEATKAFLDAAHNLRLAADVIPGLRNSPGLPSDAVPTLTPEEWAIVRSLQALYGVNGSTPRKDPDALPLAYEEPVFHPQASFKNARELRKIAPAIFGKLKPVEGKRPRSFSSSSEMLADAVLEAIDPEQISAAQVNRESLIAGIEKRYVLARESRRRDLEPTLDLLQAAWDLTDLEVEQLLAVPAGWLALWRNREAAMGLEQFEALNRLLSLHEAMRLHMEPRGYAKWLRRRWKPGSLTEGRSPIEMLLSNGKAAADQLRAYLVANALG